MIERKTQFSDCRRYRFVLWRDWSKDLLCGMDPRPRLTGDQSPKQFVQFIGLNPSTANETDNDMTITKCIGFARRWGYGALCMTNLFTFISTDPTVLLAIPEHKRRADLERITYIASGAALIVAAWGGNGAQFVQSGAVVSTLRKLGKSIHCLGKTQAGVPRHPSRISYSTKLELLP